MEDKIFCNLTDNQADNYIILTEIHFEIMRFSQETWSYVESP